MHQLEKDNKIKTYHNRQSNIKEALVHDENEPRYWTQYNRIHSYLGSIRGPGVAKEYPDRLSYNILTGILNTFVQNMHNSVIILSHYFLQENLSKVQVGLLTKITNEFREMLFLTPRKQATLSPILLTKRIVGEIIFN